MRSFLSPRVILNKHTPRVVRNTVLPSDIPLVKRILEFASTYPSAIGLAANQVRLNGFRLNKRFFVMRPMMTSEWIAIINPRIISFKGPIVTQPEGCLTYPGKTLIADRYAEIEIEFLTLINNNIPVRSNSPRYIKRQERFTGRDAQVIQHEMDHLDEVEPRFVKPKK